MEEYLAMDTNGTIACLACVCLCNTAGNPIALNTLLGKIPGGEITFTVKNESYADTRLLPPTLEEVAAELGLDTDNRGGVQFNTCLQPFIHFLQPIILLLRKNEVSCRLYLPPEAREEVRDLLDNQRRALRQPLMYATLAIELGWNHASHVYRETRRKRVLRGLSLLRSCQ